ncbi:MAG: hypothetical protein ACLFTT_00450 [Candidatus Hydrogenedentota bacterium]
MRGRRHNRVLLAALAVSALFHLSAVTVFRIVIYFPREEVEYVRFQLVQAAPSAPAADATAGRAFPGESPPPRLANIDLPTLEFAELQRLRMRQEGMLSDELRREILGEEPDDSWRSFGKQLGRLRQSLTRLSLSQGDPAPLDEPRRTPALRPAEGYTAYLEWDSAPEDRQLLFAPPIKALWQADPDTLDLPLSIVIEVTPLGRVVNVWSSTVDSSGVIDEIQLAILKYKFEPLASPEQAANQLGTLRIEQAEDGS